MPENTKPRSEAGPESHRAATRRVELTQNKISESERKTSPTSTTDIASVAETVNGVSVRPPNIDQVLKLRHLFNPPLSIIPLLVRTKMPARKWTRVINGDPFADHELVDMWTTEFNPGIATGRFSGPGLAAVDADNEQGVQWVLANLPTTKMVTDTGRPDGRHFWYRCEGDERIPCGTDVLGAKARFLWEAKEKLGLDLKVRQRRELTAQQAELAA